MEKEKRKRLFFIDAVRIFALLCVILNHIILLEEADILQKQEGAYWLKGLYIFYRLGVPLFLMLTGYLQGNKDWEKREVLIKHYLRKIPIFYMMSGFSHMLSLYSMGIKDSIELIKALFLFSSIRFDLDYIWYMYTYLVYMLIQPMVAIALKNLSDKLKRILIGITFIGTMLYPTLSALLINSGLNFSVRFDFSLLSSYVLVWIMLGDYLRKERRLNISTSVVFFACSYMAAFFYLIYMNKIVPSDLWYNNAILLPMSLCVFLWMQKCRAKNQNIQLLAEGFGKSAFIYYLIHAILLRWLIFEKNLSYIISAGLILLGWIILASIFAIMKKIKLITKE